MFFFGKEYPSIDAYIISMFVKNGTSFILFYMKYKPLFSITFQTIFKKYMIHYLSGKYIQFDGIRHLIKVLHNRLLLKNINDENTCNPLKPLKSLKSYKSKSIETKYRSNSEMLTGLKDKYRNTIYYKFTNNSVLYRIDNIIKQKYDIQSCDLIEFTINAYLSLSKNGSNDLSAFINNFLKTLIKSQLYRSTEKLRLFLLFCKLRPNTERCNTHLTLFRIMTTNQYIIPYKDTTSNDTLFYNLLINCDDTHCHDFYNLVCNQYNISTDITGTIADITQNNKYGYINYINTPFRDMFDKWVMSIINYELKYTTNQTSKNPHTYKILKSLYYLLIYMLHHSKDSLTKNHLFTFIKKLNYIYLSATITSMQIIENQVNKYAFMIDTQQSDNFKKTLMKYKKMIYIRKNIFIKLAFRYTLEYYASHLIDKLNAPQTNLEDSEFLINDIKDFIRLTCYYKETSNVKLYKELNKKCIEKILLSENYRKRYYNIGIYSRIVNDNNENIQLDKTNVFLNPHFIADYLQFLYFCYPKIKINKQIYILLVDFFIFVTKGEHMWNTNELGNIWNKLIFLIYKYSNIRKKITFPEKEKNIFFIHCILDRIHKMNLEMTELLNLVNEYNITTKYNMKIYINSTNYTNNKKYIMYILLKQLKHPKLKELFYDNAIRNQFINILNESIFQFTPNILKKYFNPDLYKTNTQKYISYIANDHELYTIYNKIYEVIFQNDIEKKYIVKTDTQLKLKFSMDSNSIFRNILEEPMFFNFKNINNIGAKTQSSNVYSVLSFLDNYIEQLNLQKNSNLDESPITYSDKFLDPIMKTEITNPILLPNSNNIMDRSILEELLVYNNINPFTQEVLFLDDVLKYNETKQAKQILEEFMKQKEEYKNKNLHK